jgi:ribosomal protein S18 acetylase RimI-like enzyme
MAEPVVREAKPQDVDQAADLVVRLKKLNEEFDSMLKVRADALERAKKYLDEAIQGDGSVVMVADVGGKVIGLVKADLKDRFFYDPRTEGVIIEFYVLPEYRRRKLGQDLINETIKQLRKRGAEMISAEFPMQNMIAVNFYNKLGFRPMIGIYGTPVE